MRKGKSNEITEIPELLSRLNVRKQVGAIGAMGTRTKIAEKIRDKKADCALALKKNRKCPYYEAEEHYQTEDIGWIAQRSEWDGLKSVGMEKKTLKRKGGNASVEYRCFISSLKTDIALFSRTVRRHWSAEAMRWHLDGTFREDANHTIDKNSAQNLNIIRYKRMALVCRSVCGLTRSEIEAQIRLAISPYFRTNAFTLSADMVCVKFSLASKQAN